MLIHRDIEDNHQMNHEQNKSKRFWRKNYFLFFVICNQTFVICIFEEAVAIYLIFYERC